MIFGLELEIFLLLMVLALVVADLPLRLARLFRPFGWREWARQHGLQHRFGNLIGRPAVIDGTYGDRRLRLQRHVAGENQPDHTHLYIETHLFDMAPVIIRGPLNQPTDEALTLGDPEFDGRFNVESAQPTHPVLLALRRETTLRELFLMFPAETVVEFQKGLLVLRVGEVLQAKRLQAMLDWVYQVLDALETAYEPPALSTSAEWTDRLQAAVDAQGTFWLPLRRVLMAWLVITLWWVFLDWLLFAENTTP